MVATFYVGDAIEVMGKLPEKSVDLILSSPPFLALRSYLPADHPDKALEGGSQSTPGEYIDWLLDVVEACARVLAPHGSLVLELGDTYSGSGGENNLYTSGYSGYAQGLDTKKPPGQGVTRQANGWPLAKSLSLIPESFRWAMVYGHNPFTGRICDTWRLRNVIRWVRPNPPVGALGDKFRPATSELMVFCKTKDRFFDLDAVREPYSPASIQRSQSDAPGHIGVRQASGTKANDEPKIEIGYRLTHSGAPPLDWWNIPPGGYPGSHYAVWPPELLIKPIKAMTPERVCRVCGEPSVRVSNGAYWRQPELAAHIKEQREAAGLTRRQVDDWFGFQGMVGHWEDADKQPGVPTAKVWLILKERLGLSDEFDAVIRHSETVSYEPMSGPGRGKDHLPKGVNPSGRGFKTHEAVRVNSAGFSDCGHDDYRPGRVLDPFGGSGTTALVATGHGRDCILIDLDERNFDLALDRVGPFILERAS